MLSDPDPSCSPLPFDIPLLPNLHSDEDPFVSLNFDDLLDIAREFEFTRTITHIWPCEEEPNTCAETRLEDILTEIVPTSTTEDDPIPMNSAPSTSVSPVNVEVDSHRLASACPAPHAVVPLPKDDNQVQAEAGSPIISTLRGWSPPNGSQFVDLDENLAVPEQAKATWNPSWLPTLLDPLSTPSARDIFASVSATGDALPQTSAIVPQSLPSTSDKSAEDPGVSTPVQPLTQALEQIRARPAALAKSSASCQTVIVTPHAKIPKSRSHPHATTSANYARAPRGGIPPHIARSVTRANIIRAEKERKVMQNAFSNMATGEAKKPSVLRRIKAGKETGKTDENNQNEGRPTKRTRV